MTDRKIVGADEDCRSSRAPVVPSEPVPRVVYKHDGAALVEDGDVCAERVQRPRSETKSCMDHVVLPIPLFKKLALALRIGGSFVTVSKLGGRYRVRRGLFRTRPRNLAPHIGNLIMEGRLRMGLGARPLLRQAA